MEYYHTRDLKARAAAAAYALKRLRIPFDLKQEIASFIGWFDSFFVPLCLFFLRVSLFVFLQVEH